MMSGPQDLNALSVGMPVVGANGTNLGTIREVYPHFLLVHQDGEHGDLDVPVHSVLRVEGGTVYVSINRESATAVDDEESAHRLIHDERA